MVVVYGQRSAAGEPEDLAALDLDRRRERHEHTLVVVRVVDDFQMVAALRSRGPGGEGERAECKGGERGGSASGFLGVHGESSLGLNVRCRSGRRALQQKRPGKSRGVLFWEGCAVSSPGDPDESGPCRPWAGSACRLRCGTRCACPTSSTHLCLSSRRWGCRCGRPRAWC